MSTETTPAAVNTTATITSPVVEITPKTEAPPEPVKTETPPEPVKVETPAEPVKTETPPAAAMPDWMQKRINELTAKRHEAERVAKMKEDLYTTEKNKNAALLEQIANKGTTEGINTKPVISEEEINRIANERAIQIAQAAAFNKACDNIADAGKNEFKNWDESLKNLSLVGAIGQDVSPEFLETAIELKEPHKILHYLGQNLEEAEKIAKLPPKKMAMEMARVEAILNAPVAVAAPAISNAPPPVTPVGGSAKVANKDINDPEISSEEFYKLRAQQIADRQKRYMKA
jgi:hypothetical protein